MKEFLSARAVEFESINVKDSEQALSEVTALGFNSVPVVAVHDHATSGIDLDSVADLLGLPYTESEGLSPDELLERLTSFLTSLSRVSAQVSHEVFPVHVPGRDRTLLGLMNHMVEIVRCLLRSISELHYDEALANAEPETDALPIVIEKEIAILGSELGNTSLDWNTTIPTYYGAQSLHQVLERCTWHVAQHFRQLESMLQELNVSIDGWPGASDYVGLPLPKEIWDTI